MSKIIELTENFQPDYLQVSAWENLAEIQRIGLPIILKVDFATANLPALFQTTKGMVEYFLLENSEASEEIDEATQSQIVS